MLQRAGRVWCMPLAVVMAAASVVGGCVILSPDEAADLSRRIRETHYLSKRVDQAVSSELSAVSEDTRRTRANTEEVMNQLREELQKTQSVVEENTFRLGELSRKVDQLRVNLYRKLGIVQAGRLEQTPVPPLPVPEPQAGGDTGKPTESGQAPAAPATQPKPEESADVAADQPAATIQAVSPEEDYQRAYRDYQKGNFELAKLGFKEYLNSYPDSEDADNAQLWLAQCYYKTGENEQALEEFHRLYTDFPNSPKIPDAMLVEALIEDKQGNRDKARTVLEKLIADYSTSTAAERAKVKLEAIGSNDGGS